jgi:hypothetical protein
MGNGAKTMQPTAMRPRRQRSYPSRRRTLIALEMMTGAAGLAGGVLLAAVPDGSLLHADLGALAGTPFSDWRVPGVLLAALVGGGLLLTGWWQWRDHPYARELSIFAGIGLIAFEVAELAWIGFQPLQVLFTLVGLAIIGLAGSTRPSQPRRGLRHIVSELGDVLHDMPVFLTAPLYRRWHLHWGATPAEDAASLPGDALLSRAQYRSTRAITIGAPPDAVWPWLVQVGCQRAGFYSNDLFDNLGRPSATTIVPSLQHLEVGQWVPMSPAATPTDRTAFKVHSFEPGKWLLWTKPDSTWAWHLTATNDGGTRLVTRIRAVYDWRYPPMALLSVLLMEFGDFAMLRRMLRGIKARAESLVQDPAARKTSMGRTEPTAAFTPHAYLRAQTPPVRPSS